jgi:hypothetical protein
MVLVSTTPTKGAKVIDSFVLIFKYTDRMLKKLQDSKLIGRKHEFASFLHSEGCVQTV